MRGDVAGMCDGEPYRGVELVLTWRQKKRLWACNCRGSDLVIGDLGAVSGVRNSDALRRGMKG